MQVFTGSLILLLLGDLKLIHMVFCSDNMFCFLVDISFFLICLFVRLLGRLVGWLVVCLSVSFFGSQSLLRKRWKYPTSCKAIKISVSTRENKQKKTFWNSHPLLYLSCYFPVYLVVRPASLCPPERFSPLATLLP